jgi:hypothetical protein
MIRDVAATSAREPFLPRIDTAPDLSEPIPENAHICFCTQLDSNLHAKALMRKVAICVSAHQHSLNNPNGVAGSGVVAGHGGCANAGRSAEADVTSSSEEELGDRFSTACPLSVMLGPRSHPYGPAKLDFSGMMAVRRRSRTAS